VVPQVAAVLGPCAAGTSERHAARLLDHRDEVGEETTDHDMGGSQVHCYVSGVGDLEVDDDPACIAAVRTYLSFMPSNNRETPPRRTTSDRRDRRLEDIDTIVPTNPRAAYDMRKVVTRLADDGHVFEVNPTFARNVITALVRLNGQSAGIVASQPMIKGGALDIDAADKAARFIWLCDAFNIPLVFLQDVPGFIVGAEVERQGIIRHGAKMLFAVSEATVPKVTVVLRKAYGAGYFVMCGRGYEPDALVAWPTAEISVMGPEGAVDIIFTKQIAAAEDPVAARSEYADAVRQTIDPYIAASWAMVDDIIDPADTRRVIIDALEGAATKGRQRAWRKHGVPPV
jgi:acetyl-CoA carboxylase carboxyltransferase component